VEEEELTGHGESKTKERTLVQKDPGRGKEGKRDDFRDRLCILKGKADTPKEETKGEKRHE